MMYQAQKVLIADGKTADLLKLLDRSEAAMKAGPDLYHAAMGWCEAEGKKDMATAVLKHASDKFPADVVSWLHCMVVCWQARTDAKPLRHMKRVPERSLTC